jgi:hypothetical protein
VTRVSVAILAALGLLACEKTAPPSELTRDECVKLVIRLDELRNKELGRANSVEQRTAVDRCLEHGTKKQMECVEFASNAGEVARCDELTK